MQFASLKCGAVFQLEAPETPAARPLTPDCIQFLGDFIQRLIQVSVPSTDPNKMHLEIAKKKREHVIYNINLY